MAFKTINTPDKNLQLIQDSMAAALTPLQVAPLTGGVIISNVLISSGDNQIAHKLGKTPNKWMITDITGGGALFYRVSWDDLYITLNASSSCTASFWVST